MLINHVLSNDLYSNIFEAILGYFRAFSPADLRIEVTSRPIQNADVYHYHRPQLEQRLLSPSVVTVHHDLEDATAALSLAEFLPRYRQANRVVCLNQHQARLLSAEGIDHTAVIPHGYNEAVLGLRASSSFGAERVRLGVFSKRYQTRFKGEAYLQDLAKRLDPEDFEFMLVGEGRDVTACFLEDLGYSVRLYLHLPYALFNAAYESIDCLLMCSEFEGGPANVPEALATGTPVLSSRVGLAADFVRDGLNGLVLSGDADRDADRIALLAQADHPLRATLRDGALDARGSVPTWQEVVGRYVALYRTLGGAA